MNVKKGLIIKDFTNLKSYKSTVLAILILYILAGFLNENMANIMPVIIPLCFGMMGISSFNYDSIAKSDRYVLTLPVSKKDIVKARYLYIFLITLIGMILSILIYTILQIKMQTSIIDGILYSFGAFLGIMVLQIFQIPIMYKFGAEKGRIIQMVGIVLLMLTISGAVALIIKMLPITLEDFKVMLQQYGLAIITLVVSILYIISYKISLKIYEKKEI